MFKLYSLSDPETGKVRYIGQTKRTLNSRYNRHIRESQLLKTRKDSWIVSLNRRGIKPMITLIHEACCEDCLNHLEVLYISYYNMIGNRLVNLESGGKKYTHFHETTKKKMSETKKTFWSIEENRKTQIGKIKEGRLKHADRIREIQSAIAKKYLQDKDVRIKANEGIRKSLASEDFKVKRSIDSKKYWAGLDSAKRKERLLKFTRAGNVATKEKGTSSSEKNLAHIKKLAVELRNKKSKPFEGFLNGQKVGEWTNLIDAERELGIVYPNIHAVLNGRAKTAKKHTFVYKKEAQLYFTK